MSTIRVSIDGETHEVDASNVEAGDGLQIVQNGEAPEGFVTQETMNAKVKNRLSDERRRIINGDGEKASEIRQQVLKNAGVPLGDDGTPDLDTGSDFDPDQERERIKGTIYEQEVQPLESKLEELQGQREQLLQTRKNSEIQSAASKHNVRDEYLNAPTEGIAPPIVQIAGSSLGYDAERDTFAIKGQDGFQPASKQGQTWAGVDDLFERMKEKEQYQHLFGDSRPGATEPGDTTGAQSNGKKMTREDMRNGKVDPSDVLSGDVTIE